MTFNGEYAGIQCKDKAVGVNELTDEIRKAEDFKPPLKELVFAVATLRDAKVQEEIREIDWQRTKDGKFSVRILFWDDLCLRLAADASLMEKLFPQFVEKKASFERITKIIESSSPSDWLFDGDRQLFTHKNDVHLTIQRQDSEKDREFVEEWANQFPDKRAFLTYYIVAYGGSLVETLPVIGVDFYRQMIPMPDLRKNKSDPLKISRREFIVGKIINSVYNSYPLRAMAWMVRDSCRVALVVCSILYLMHVCCRNCPPFGGQKKWSVMLLSQGNAFSRREIWMEKDLN